MTGKLFERDVRSSGDGAVVSFDVFMSAFPETEVEEIYSCSRTQILGLGTTVVKIVNLRIVQTQRFVTEVLAQHAAAACGAALELRGCTYVSDWPWTDSRDCALVGVLCMERAEGSLFELARHPTDKPDDALLLEWMEAIFEQHDKMVSMGVLHGDPSSQNVAYTKEGNDNKVFHWIDFGNAILSEHVSTIDARDERHKLIEHLMFAAAIHDDNRVSYIKSQLRQWI